MRTIQFNQWYEIAKKSVQAALKSVYAKYFLILFAIFLVALIPLFRANFNYIDDLGRIREGYLNFGFGRYTSNIAATVVNAGRRATDLSPYTQILAAAIMALSCTLAIKLLTSSFGTSLGQKSKFNLWYVIAALPLGLSPYFMENYSYKFDSPYMALSVLFSIIPFLFYRDQSKCQKIISVVIIFICTIGMCTTYQASSGIFPALTAILALLMFVKQAKYKEIGQFIGLSALGYCLGTLVFQFFVSRSGSYLDAGMLKFSEIIPGIFSNYDSYIKAICRDFKPYWLVLIFAVYVMFIVSCIMRSKQRKISSAIFAMLIACFVGIMSFGLYVLIRSPLFAPRSMYGFFANFALVAIVAVNYYHAYISKLCVLYLGYAFFVFAITYGNALAEQKHYADYRATLLMNDLNTLNTPENQTLEVAINGTIGFSTPIDGLIPKYPVLNSLVQPLLSDNSWFWGSYYMFSHYRMPGIIESRSKFDPTDLKLVKETRLHNIYQKDNRVLVELK